MSKAFSFDFATDDIDEDAQGDACSLPDINRAQNTTNVVPPQVHLLQDVLSTFPSHLSFDTISIPGDGGTKMDIPRRDLLDIRTQLMAEDGALSCNSPAGLSTDDIIPNIYEGGFKTWECSVDLSNYVCSDVITHDESLAKDFFVIEVCAIWTVALLGAGTALPSLAFLHKWLFKQRSYLGAAPKLQICLADYNRSVLDLATIPNLYLAVQLHDQQIVGTDIDSGPENLNHFQSNLFDLGINVSVMSGSWTPKFAELLPLITRSSPGKPHETIILASETIYSPASTRAFAQLLLNIMRRLINQGSDVKALVAAKRIYFGVGGGTDDFLEVLEELGGRGIIVWETQGSGVGRVIIAVELTPID